MIIYDSSGTQILSVAVDDNSFRNRRIMGDHNLTLYFSLAEHIEIPVGAYCIFEGERYTLERPENLKMKHSRYFEYTVLFESPEAKAKIWKFRNTVDGRLKFSLTAKPKEHLQMFVDNMNRRDTGWTVGECIEGVERLISYDHIYCYEALSLMASECETEFYIKGKQVSLCKVELNKDNPLPLSYGRGNGFKSGVARQNGGDTPPVEILYVQGGTDNIDASVYGNAELLLPKGQQIGYDGKYFLGQSGFNADNARYYVVDEEGLSIRRADKEVSSLTEDSLDCSDIYPKRVGEVTAVSVVDEANNFYDFVDNTIPSELNYEDYLIAGESMTVIFQSGMLAGKEFEVKYYHEAVDGKAARRFEIVPQEIDGITMPNKTFAPQAGNTYAVFKCALPDAYIRNDSDRSGASWDMFREAVRYLYEHEELQFTFTGELDGLWAKKDWVNIGGRIVLGGYVLFSDERFQREGVLVRITGIKDYINNPHSPEIELSNTPVSAGFSSTIKQLEAQEIIIDNNYRSSVQFTKRRFRDAQETISMLEEALLNNFTASVSPIAVKTMSMLVGDESLQFRFVNNTTNPSAVQHSVTYDNSTKQLIAEAGIMQHLTLGIKSLSSSHEVSEYKFWAVSEFTSAALLDGSKGYYLYIRANRNDQNAVFYLSETAIEMEAETAYYYFLVGILNSEYEGERSFATMYGFSEVLPGRVTTDRVVSGDGQSYFDMLANAMKLGDVLDFNSQGDGRLRLKGTIVQNQGGDESPVGVYRGLYNADYTYYNGDEVQYTVNGITSTYRYIYADPSKGISPSNATYWQVQAAGVKGDKGDDGADGKDGADGTSVAVSKNDITYQASNSGTIVPTGTWLTSPPALQNGQFLWTRTIVTYTDGNSTTAYSVSYYGTNGTNGKDGEDGADGKDGTSITIKSSTVLYAVEATGTQPADSAFTYSTIPVVEVGLFLWSLTKVVYSDGTETKCYGVFRIGQDGEQGAQGVAGADGKTSYLHIKYSNDGGQTFSNRTGLRMAGFKSLRLMGNGGFRFADDNIGEVAGEWIGTYVDYEPMDSTDVFRYKWVKIKGSKGDVGDYYEYRYAKNGSTTTPPAIDTSVLAPDGWTTEQPTIGDLEYLWVTMAKISGDGQTLLQAWSTPVRFTPKDGTDGKQGYSPALAFQGEYSSTQTYYGNQYRVDAVKYNGAYYVARVDAGAFSGTLPTDTSKWNPFGASFESVATLLLLAEYANIGNFVIKNNCLMSQKGTINGVASTDFTNDNFVPNILLDGLNGQSVISGSIRNPFVAWSADQNVFDGDIKNGIGRYDNVVMPITTSSSAERTLTSDQFTWTPDNSGRIIRIINYKWSTGTAYGHVILTAPSGKYFYENGKARTQIKMSRECLVLAGYGTPTTFYGWVVLSRVDVYTNGYYGAPLKVLYQGVFNPTSTYYIDKLWSEELANTGIAETWHIKIIHSDGKYRVYLPKYITSSYWHVMLTPCGYGVSGTITENVRYATLMAKGSEAIDGVLYSYFDVWTADDSSVNPSGFLFQIIGIYDWISPTEAATNAATASTLAVADVEEEPVAQPASMKALFETEDKRLMIQVWE